MINKYINKILCGDCLKILPLVPDNSIDMVFTDPPYQFISVGKTGLQGGGFMKPENKKHLEKIKESFGINYSPEQYLAECKRILKKFNGYFFTNKTLLTRYIAFAEKNRYKWELLLWLKPNPCPLNKSHYLIDKEYIVFIKEPTAYFNSNLGYEKYFTYRSYPIGKKGTFHPTEKPLSIVKDLIEISSKENDIIFDGYIGSGTTAIGAKQLNRRYIGVEISEEYCKIAENRLRQTEEPLF